MSGLLGPKVLGERRRQPTCWKVIHVC